MHSLMLGSMIKYLSHSDVLKQLMCVFLSLMLFYRDEQPFMGEDNRTSVTEFIFLGLSQDPQTQVLLFFLFLFIYLLTVLGNLLIIVLIHSDPRLHTPMYLETCPLQISAFLLPQCPKCLSTSW